MSVIPTLQTDRLTLRGPKLEDLPALSAFFATERSHYVGGPRNVLDSHRSLLAPYGSWALYGHGLCFVADKATDAVMGWAGLVFGPGWEEPELAWSVFAEAEGKGIAFEAAFAARTYSAKTLGHDGVVSYIAPDNSRSAALAERLGAVFERTATFQIGDVHIWRHPKLAEAA